MVLLFAQGLWSSRIILKSMNYPMVVVCVLNEMVAELDKKLKRGKL